MMRKTSLREGFFDFYNCFQDVNEHGISSGCQVSKRGSFFGIIALYRTKLMGERRLW
jgi:hypothetical protein